MIRIKDLQTTYKDLSQTEKDNLLSKAAQIDAVRSAQESYQKLRGVVGESVDAFANGGFKGLFQSIKDRFKNFLKEMITQWLTSKIFKVFSGRSITPNQSNSSGFLKNIFGGLFGGSSSNGIGGSVFGSGNQGTGIFNFAGGGLGSNIPTGALVNLPNGNQAYNVNGGSQANALSSLFSSQGISSAIASGGITAALALLQYSLTTKSPLKGLAAGGLLGLTFGFINRSRERRKEEQQRTEFLNSAFASIGDFDKIISDVKSLHLDPSSGLAQGDSLAKMIHDQYVASANPLKDKKTRNIALQELGRIDSEIAAKMAELKAAANKAQSAKDFEGHIIGEFASGGVIHENFMKQFAGFKEQYGILQGGTPGRDSIPVWAMEGELFANKAQQARINRAAGFDVLAHTGIPNYPNKPRPMADGGFIGTSLIAAPNVSPAPQTFVFQFEHSIDANGMVNTVLKNSDEAGKNVKVIIEDKAKNGELRLQKRTG